MSTISSYPAGVPCWVDTFQPDPQAAVEFYGPLLDWTFDDPVAGLTGEYRTARFDGRLVAGIGTAPAGFPSAVWTTYIAGGDVDETVRRATAAGGDSIVGPATHRDDGRMAVLTDPAGVAFGIWQARARHGAEPANEAGTWTMSSLHTPARDASAAFYGYLFGWTLERVPGPPMAFWRLDGHVGGEAEQPMPRDVVAVLAPIDAGDPTPPHWSIALSAEDVDATTRHASELGAPCCSHRPSHTPS